MGKFYINPLTLYIFFIFLPFISAMAFYGIPYYSPHMLILIISLVAFLAGYTVANFFHLRKVSLYRLPFRMSFLYFFSFIANILLSVYFLYKLNFNLPLFDHHLRPDLYKNAGYLWPLYISSGLIFSGVSALMARGPNKATNLTLLTIFLVTAFSFGMKNVLLYFSLTFLVTYLSISKFFLKLSFFKVVYFLVIFICVLVLINVARAGVDYSFTYVFYILFNYIFPSFSNLFNLISDGSCCFYSPGMSLVYPVAETFLLDENWSHYLPRNLLDWLTFNVFTGFAPLLIIGGEIEVLIFFLFFGFFSNILFKYSFNQASFVSSFVYAQFVICFVMFHNSMYFQSLSPIFSIFVVAIFYKFRIQYRD